MKKLAGLTATLLAMLLCLGMFAGCSETEEESSSSESSSETSSDTSSESSVSEEESSEEADQEGDVIGQITYVGSTTLVLDVYEPDSEVTDYTAMDDVTLTDADETRSVTLEDDAVFQSVSEGTLTDITMDDLAEGDMVAIITDEEGVQTVIVLDVEVDTTADDTTSDASATAESSALEEAAGETDSEA